MHRLRTEIPPLGDRPFVILFEQNRANDPNYRRPRRDVNGTAADVLEANRYDRDERTREPRQAFYARLRKPRELTHDTNR